MLKTLPPATPAADRERRCRIRWQSSEVAGLCILVVGFGRMYACDTERRARRVEKE